jgi:hypothetical protein
MCGRHADVGDERGAKVASARAPATVIIIKPALQKTRGAKRRDSSLISAYGRNPLSLPVHRRGGRAGQIRFTLLRAQARPLLCRGSDRIVYVRFVRTLPAFLDPSRER